MAKVCAYQGCQADISNKKSTARFCSLECKQHDWNESDAHYTACRKYHLKTKFGMSLEDYDELFVLQDGKCAICKQAQSRSLAVDHNHETGGVRGLLCDLCNTGLGNFRDNRLFLAHAAEYLLINR